MEPSDNGSPFEKRIMAAFPELNGSHRKLARFALDNGLYVAFASATEFGEQVGLSAATVVRFCQAVGYDGYTEFQQDIRSALPSYQHKVHRLEKGDRKLDPEQILEHAFEHDAQNLKQTLEHIPAARFTSAVELIVKADDVLIIGAGLSSAPATYLGHSLNVMGIPVRTVTCGGIPLSLELVKLKPTSVLVAFSVWRYVTETVQAMDRAQTAGASRIAITDSMVSPIAQRADVAFQVSTRGVAHSLSLTSAMALIDALIAALSNARPEETARALREVDSAYRQGTLLYTE